MKFFLILKSLFNKDISILPFQREDMVAFVKLKNNCIKINSHALVDENYNLVIVYYNKVCDILTSGNHKLNEDTIPKLYRFSKTPFGLKALTTRSIDCDAYYVNLKEFSNNYFKTIDRVIALSEGQKLKIKLDGTFTMKVCDTLKFMKALCNDYAVIRNKKTKKEICNTVGYEASKALNSKNFSVDDYIFNKDKIISTIEELVNNHTKTFGIEVSNFAIGEVIINKKYLNEVQLNALEQTEKANSKELKEDSSKLVEEKIETLQEDSRVIYAGGGESEKAKESINGESKVNIANGGANLGDSLKTKDIKEDEISKSLEQHLEESARKILENPIIKNEEDIFIKDINKTSTNYNVKYNSTNKIYTTNTNVGINTGRENKGKFDEIYSPLNSRRSSQNNNPYGNGSKDYYKQPEPKIIGVDSDREIFAINREKESINKSTYSSKNNINEKPKEINKVKQEAKQIDLKNKRTEEKNSSEIKQEELIKVKPKAKSKMVCSVCGAVVLETKAKFCEKCGNKLNNYKTCACCSAKNFVDATECCICKSVLD